MSTAQIQALEDALGSLPKKGGIDFTFKGWSVAANLHEWAVAHGFLTGCVFTKTKKTGPKGKKTKTLCKLLLVGTCPWGSGHLRHYTVTLSPETWLPPAE